MQFAIIGLGVFGQTSAKELQKLGNQVLAIDINEKLVDDISEYVTRAVIADATDKETLQELDLANFDGVLVSIGDNLEASLLCTLNLLSMNVRNLWVKAKTDSHHQILQSLGVTNIVHPEQDMGIRIAQKMNYPMVRQYMALGDEQFMIRLDPPEQWRGHPWSDIQQQHPDILFFMLKRNGQLYNYLPADYFFQGGDKLVVGGDAVSLRRLAKAIRQTAI
ncbi:MULTISPECIES: potassium channel family protein [unclassified Moraxella]|uniref:potassium channel family protein n=1 Tax=unclassified Moraxella TaxID=2685852 RepID=UPI003AF6E31B